MSNLATEYERDFDAWIQQHIALLKQGKVNEIDVEHLIEELEDMGRSNKRELSSHFKILIAHLLKWQFQLRQLSNYRESWQGGSWQTTIVEQRSQIADILEENPSLKRQIPESITKAYPKAVGIAVDETNLPKSTFPDSCPYTIDQLLDRKFYPNPQD
jgi:hypothetical protein